MADLYKIGVKESIGNVISDLERPLATEIVIPPLSIIEKSAYNVETVAD